MSDVVEQAKQALEGVTPEPWDVRDGFVYPLAIRCGLGGIRPQDAEFISAARTLVPELVAEVDRLHTWDGLMSLLDEHWPDDIFPTMEDREDRDPGLRIVSLIRWVEHLRGLQRDDRNTAIAATAERDTANAEVERLRGELQYLKGRIAGADGAREDVAKALRPHLGEQEYLGVGVWRCPCGEVWHNGNHLADAAIAAHLEALKADGYELVEKRNAVRDQWGNPLTQAAVDEDDARQASEGLDYLTNMARGHDYADDARINDAADAVAYVLDAHGYRHEEAEESGTPSEPHADPLGDVDVAADEPDDDGWPVREVCI